MDNVLFNNPKGFAEIIKTDAEQVAKEIIKSKNGKNVNSYTQLRRYYDELLRIQMMTSVKTNEFDKYLPTIYILGSKIAYANARRTLSDDIANFLEQNIKEIKNKADFDNFIMYYEAILGYMKYYENKNKNNNKANGNNKGGK